jgi:hypothetical protein
MGEVIETEDASKTLVAIPVILNMYFSSFLTESVYRDILFICISVSCSRPFDEDSLGMH